MFMPLNDGSALSLERALFSYGDFTGILDILGDLVGVLTKLDPLSAFLGDSIENV